MVKKSDNYSEPIIFAQNICKHQNICNNLSPTPLFKPNSAQRPPHDMPFHIVLPSTERIF